MSSRIVRHAAPHYLACKSAIPDIAVREKALEEELGWEVLQAYTCMGEAGWKERARVAGAKVASPVTR